MRTCTRPSSGGSRRIVSRCVPSDIWPSDTRTGAICAAGEAGLDAGDVSSGAATAAAGVGVLDGAAGGPASIAIGEAGCADGETGAPSAVSWPDGAAVVRVSDAVGCDPAWVCAAADSGPWLAGVLDVERADRNSAARGSATGFAAGSARKSTAGVGRRHGRGPRRGRRLGEWRRRPSLLHRRTACGGFGLDNLWRPRLSAGIVHRAAPVAAASAMLDAAAAVRSGRYCRRRPAPDRCEAAVGGGGIELFAADGALRQSRRSASARPSASLPVGAGLRSSWRMRRARRRRRCIADDRGSQRVRPGQDGQWRPVAIDGQSRIRQALHRRHGERSAAGDACAGERGSAGSVCSFGRLPWRAERAVRADGSRGDRGIGETVRPSPRQAAAAAIGSRIAAVSGAEARSDVHGAIPAAPPRWIAAREAACASQRTPVQRYRQGCLRRASPVALRGLAARDWWPSSPVARQRRQCSLAASLTPRRSGAGPSPIATVGTAAAALARRDR